MDDARGQLRRSGGCRGIEAVEIEPHVGGAGHRIESRFRNADRESRARGTRRDVPDVLGRGARGRHEHGGENRDRDAHAGDDQQEPVQNFSASSISITGMSSTTR